MLTAAQCRTVAFSTEDGELLCLECGEETDDEGFRLRVREVSAYEMGEWQSDMARDAYEGSDPPHVGAVRVIGTAWSATAEQYCECEPAVFCDQCGREIAEEIVGDDCELLAKQWETAEEIAADIIDAPNGYCTPTFCDVPDHPASHIGGRS